MQPPGVAVVVLNWNGWKDTLECLNSLAVRLQHNITTVVVVDNHSTDDSVQKISAWIHAYTSAGTLFLADVDLDSVNPAVPPKLVLVQSEVNRGYAGGNNLGLRFVLACGFYDFAWVLNNDTTIDVHAVAALLDCAAGHPEAWLLGSTIVEYDHPTQVQCAGGSGYIPLLTLNRPALGGTHLDEATKQERPPKLAYISGAAMFIRTTALRRIGLLNEDYFLYYEELDYARRVRSAGHSLMWCRDSIVRHKAGATAGSTSIGNPRKSTLSEYHSTLSALKFTAHHYPALLAFAFVCRLALKLCWCLVPRRWYLYPAVLKAYKDYLSVGRR